MQPQSPDSLENNVQSPPSPAEPAPTPITPSPSPVEGGVPGEPPRKSNKTPFIIAVVVGIVVLLIIGAVVVMLVNRTSPAPNSQAITLTQYKSTSMGFELKIPQSWRTSFDNRPSQETSLFVNFEPPTQAKEVISIACQKKSMTKDVMFNVVETSVIPKKEKALTSVSRQEKTQIGTYPVYKFVATQVDISSERLSKETVSYHAYYLISSEEFCSLYVALTKSRDMGISPLESKAGEIIGSFKRL